MRSLTLWRHTYNLQGQFQFKPSAWKSGDFFFFSVLSDPDSASDSDMHVFSVDFMHLLERKVADSWALTEGKHHPVGLTLCPVWST